MCKEFCPTNEVRSLSKKRLSVLKEKYEFTKILVDEIENKGSLKAAIKRQTKAVELNEDLIASSHIWTAHQRGDLFAGVCFSETVIGAETIDFLVHMHLEGKLENDIVFNDDWYCNKILFAESDIPIVIFIVKCLIERGDLIQQEQPLNRAQRRSKKK